MPPSRCTWRPITLTLTLTLSLTLTRYATFALHVALGREITPEMAVITLALLNVVQLSLTKFFCLGVEFGAQSLVSDPNPNH